MMNQGNQLTHFPAFYRGSLLLPWPVPTSSASWFGGSSSVSSTEARAMAASKTHSEAEKRRRERINTHLSTLRRLIPSANKMDKASLLARVIDHVKDLKRKAAEIGKGCSVPAEDDEVSVECDGNGGANDGISGEGSILIRASFCCDDRPELLADLIQALHNLRLKTVKAEISTLGGRVRNVFVLRTKDAEERLCPSSVKETLKAVLGRVTLSNSSTTAFSCKRQRVFQFDSSTSSL